MRPTAVFLDLDDTILDGVSAAQAAWEVVGAEWGPRLGCEPSQLREAVRRESIEFWKDESKVERKWRTRLREARAHVIGITLEAEGWDGRHARSIADDYGDEHRVHLRPFPDAYDTLDAMSRAGLRLGLLTNGPAALQRDKIERFELSGYFDVIVVEGEFGYGKPNKRVFCHALDAVGAEATMAWHVGDNLYADIWGAQRAGIHAVWIHRDRLELREDAPAIPDRVVGSLHEVREAVLAE